MTPAELAAIRKRHALDSEHVKDAGYPLPSEGAHWDREALLAHVAELERERAQDIRESDTYQELRAELAEAKREARKGWDAFYKLRASVAQRDYPGLTRQVKTAGDGLSKAIDAALKDTP